MVSNKKIGILGGGQLGKMLAEAASPWYIDLHFLDVNRDFPAGQVAPYFHLGDFTDYEDVVRFGQDKDILSIEIEKINLEAWIELENSGKRTIPSSQVLRTIRDKGLQKVFYRDHGFPTSDFTLYEDRRELWQAILDEELTYPFVQKSRRGGYDGRGVAVINGESDLPELMDTPCLVEKKVDIDKELALILGRNASGHMTSFPMVEMEFDPKANLVKYLLCPANVSENVVYEAEQMGRRLMETLNVTGLLAIEFFLDKDGKLLINEVAPRPHNSGHHTIEACSLSQYDVHLRCLLDLPLPQKVSLLKPAGMYNLLGEKGFEGTPKIERFNDVVNLPDTYVHWYGKPETRAMRKMGHVTVMGDSIEEVRKKLDYISNQIKIVA